MFGYVRPMRAELKVREFEAYRSCYCGLCRVLKEEYGARARMVLNYDFTFLAMLLWEPDVPFEIRKDRCAVMPCRKHCACRTGESLRLSAGYSVILAWWKLCDTVEDEDFSKRLPQEGLDSGSAGLIGRPESSSLHLTGLSESGWMRYTPWRRPGRAPWIVWQMPLHSS